MAGFRDRVAQSIETLHPAYFALVMSTGIVSIAFAWLGHDLIANFLFILNVVFFVVLSTVFLTRLVRYFDTFRDDFQHSRRCWGFLTVVVGINTLGSQFFVLVGEVEVAQGLWVLGLATWVVFLYGIYFYLITHHDGPVESIVTGATLLTIVATQSVAVLGSQIAGAFGEFSNFIYLLTLTHFAAGWILYLIFVTLVTYRLIFRELEPADWEGPYWICMGAAAITTLAGSNVLLHLDVGELYEATLVITYLAWAIGAWWIPIQLYLDVWKFRRFELDGDRPWWITVFPWARLGFGRRRAHVFDPPAWGRVFPMGMFTACTIALTEVSGFDVLFLIPLGWGWFALLVWVLTALGNARAVYRVVDPVRVIKGSERSETPLSE